MASYIIEHPTRGVLMEQDGIFPHETGPTIHDGWRSRFSWSKPRTEGHHFFSHVEVHRALRRLPPKLLAEVHVLRDEAGHWEPVDEMKVVIREY
jgi:hypothetical protein